MTENLHTRGYNSSFGKDYCTIDGSIYDGMKSGGKKAFKWTYNTPHPDGGQFSIDLDVMILRPTPGNRFKHEDPQPLRFSVSHQYSHNSFEDTDIDRLKTTVMNDLDKYVEIMVNVKWEPWLQVKVVGGDSDFTDSDYSSKGVELKIEIQRLKKGIHPKTGKELTIGRNSVVTKFPKCHDINELPDNRRFIVNSNRGEISYIPETDENLAALNDIQSKLTDLKYRLATFLSQDKVTITLGELKEIWSDKTPLLLSPSGEFIKKS